MREQGRSATWLADRLGLSRGHVSNMLLGHRRLPADVAERMALLLGVPRDLLAPAAEGAARISAGVGRPPARATARPFPDLIPTPDPDPHPDPDPEASS
jgi:transcriptional regulator with XRE-family HTH domain